MMPSEPKHQSTLAKGGRQGMWYKLLSHCTGLLVANRDKTTATVKRWLPIHQSCQANPMEAVLCLTEPMHGSCLGRMDTP